MKEEANHILELTPSSESTHSSENNPGLENYPSSEVSHRAEPNPSSLINPGESEVFDRCELCDKRFKNKKTLKQHMSNKHSSDPATAQKLSEINAKKSLKLKCTLCENLFNTRKINEHFRLMHPEVSLKANCDECEKSFSDASHLNKHKIQVHTDIKKYQCEFCDYKTKLKETLKEHLKIHGDQHFECELCGCRVNRKRDLRKHLCKPKNFSCEQGGNEAAQEKTSHLNSCLVDYHLEFCDCDRKQIKCF